MTYGEFEKIWEESLQKELEGLEDMRKKERTAIIVSGLAFIIPLFLSLIIWQGFNLVSLLSVIAGIVIYIFMRPKGYREKYKELVISALVSRTKYGWKLISSTSTSLPAYASAPTPAQTGKFMEKMRAKIESNKKVLKDFADSGLYYTQITTFNVDDMFVSGTNPGLHIEEVTASAGSGKNKRIVFHGLFFSFKIGRQFTGETYVRGDNESWTSPVGTSASRSFFSKTATLSRTELEWNDFEKLLNVDTTNEIEAREILDPYFMENLYEWWKNHKKSVRLSWRGDHMYMTIRSRGNLFEPNPFGSIESHKTKLWEYLDNLLIAENLFAHIERKYDYDINMKNMNSANSAVSHTFAGHGQNTLNN